MTTTREMLGSSGRILEAGDALDESPAPKDPSVEKALYALLDSRLAGQEGAHNILPGTPEARTADTLRQTIGDLWELAEKKKEGITNVFPNYPDTNRLVIDKNGNVVPIESVSGATIGDNKSVKPAVNYHANRRNEDPRDAISYRDATLADFVAAIEANIAKQYDLYEQMADRLSDDEKEAKNEALRKVLNGLEDFQGRSEQDVRAINEIKELAAGALDGRMKREYKGPLYMDLNGAVLSRDMILETVNGGKPMSEEEAAKYSESAFVDDGYTNLGFVSTKSPESFVRIIESGPIERVKRGAHALDQ